MTEKNFPALLESRRPEIEKMLASWVTPDRFFAMAMQVRHNPDLAQCTDESLVECIVQAAQMGLEYGPKGHIYAIPYGKVAQPQPGWRGLAFLRLRAGAVLQIDTDIVCEQDTFEVGRSTEGDVFRHIINYKGGDRSEKHAYAAYARVKLPDGSYEFEVCARERIMRHRMHSKQPNGLLWTKFWEEGWRKTPYRILDKRLPEGVNREAIERYALAAAAEATVYKRNDPVEHDEPPDNLPVDDPEPANDTGGGVNWKIESVEMADATLTDQQINRVLSLARRRGMSMSDLEATLLQLDPVPLINGNADVSAVRQSQLAALEKEMGA